MREPLELRIRHQRHGAHQASSDARVTKAVFTIAVALLLVSSGASATECQSSPGRDGKWWSWRIVDSKRCWYQGRPGRSKDLLQWAKQSPPPVVTRLDPGDRLRPAPPVPPQQLTQIIDPTPKLVPTGSMSAPTTEALQTVPRPPSLPEQPPLPAKPTKPSKWWMLLLIIPAIATGLAVVASRFHPARKEGRPRNLVQELPKTVDELADTHGRPTRSNGGQHHAVVTPRVEASPDRPEFAKLGETIAASVVQAQKQANHASALLEQTARQKNGRWSGRPGFK